MSTRTASEARNAPEVIECRVEVSKYARTNAEREFILFLIGGLLGTGLALDKATGQVCGALMHHRWWTAHALESAENGRY